MKKREEIIVNMLAEDPATDLNQLAKELKCNIEWVYKIVQRHNLETTQSISKKIRELQQAKPHITIGELSLTLGYTTGTIEKVLNATDPHRQRILFLLNKHKLITATRLHRMTGVSMSICHRLYNQFHQVIEWKENNLNVYKNIEDEISEFDVKSLIFDQIESVDYAYLTRIKAKFFPDLKSGIKNQLTITEPSRIGGNI